MAGRKVSTNYKAMKTDHNLRMELGSRNRAIARAVLEGRTVEDAMRTIEMAQQGVPADEQPATRLVR